MYDKKAAVEAILFANGSPAEPDKIAQAIEMNQSQEKQDGEKLCYQNNFVCV